MTTTAPVATSTYLAWARRHAPTSMPANVASAVKASGQWSQYPWTGKPSSPRIIVGTDKRLLCEPPTTKLLAAFESWVCEEQQRNLPDGPPDPIFYDYAGPVKAAWPLNSLGEAVQITTWDAQHLTVDQLLTVAHMHHDATWRVRAWKQAEKLRQAVYAVVLNPKKVGNQGQPLSGNARAAGYVLDFGVKMNRAMPQPSDWTVLATMIYGLHKLTTQQLAAWPEVSPVFGCPLPFVPLNPAGLTQADHKNCQWQTWQILGPYLLGLCEVFGLAVQAGVPGPALDPLTDLIHGALAYADLAFAKGVGNRPADNLDPSGKVGNLDKPSMHGWCLWGLREADYYGLLSSDLKARCVKLRDATGYADDLKATDSTDDHAMGLMLLCGEWLGFKGAVP